MSYRNAIATSALLLLAALMAACGPNGGRSNDKPLAMVNGEPVSYSEYKIRLSLQSLGFAEVTGLESESSDAKVEVLGLLIEEKLLLQEAARLGISVPSGEVESVYSEAASDYPGDGFAETLTKTGLSPSSYRETIEKKLLIGKLVRRVVFDNISVSDADARSYFNKNRDSFAEPATVRAKQVVLDTRHGAEAALKRIQAGEDFSKVASDVSLSPDGKDGGDLGYFSRDEMPPEFEEVAFSMKPGEMSGVVETPYGFHVFMLIDRKGSSNPKFEDVGPAVKERLKEKRFEAFYAEWMAALRDKAEVEVSEDFMDRL
jgi:peptidyl-prolyl cis-trans isomerase C